MLHVTLKEKDMDLHERQSDELYELYRKLEKIDRMQATLYAEASEWVAGKQLEDCIQAFEIRKNLYSARYDGTPITPEKQVFYTGLVDAYNCVLTKLYAYRASQNNYTDLRFIKCNGKTYCVKHAFLNFVTTHVQDMTPENISAFLTNVLNGNEADAKQGPLEFSNKKECCICNVEDISIFFKRE